MPARSTPLRILEPVRDALRAGRPVVALESSMIAQGLPIPANREAAARMSRAIESRGGICAITAIVRGTATVGLEDAELERFLRRDGVRKVSARDLAPAMAAGADGATTVAGALALATLAGIRVVATGGIGGVHHEPDDDESADLAELAHSPVIVVCAGAKSILNLPATLERLDSYGVTVVGYRTGTMPGFYTADTGLPLPARADTAAEIAAIFTASQALGRGSAIVVMQPPPEGSALPAELVERAVTDARAGARSASVRGSALTPYLLAAMEALTGGRSLPANLALLEENAALAAEIARELPTLGAGGVETVRGRVTAR